ncbi:hypothetical protein EDC04DRAFT_2831832, partial [Pisolithus marmoratus]
MTGRHAWIPVLLTVNVQSCWLSERARHLSHASLHRCSGLVEILLSLRWMYQGLPSFSDSMYCTSLSPKSSGSTFRMWP